jgi:hypothetical protein
MAGAGGGRPANPTSGTPSYPAGGGSAGTNAPSQLPANSRGVYGLKDLKLMEKTSSGVQSTVLTSDGKNVHLDGGTRLLLVAQGSVTSAQTPSN